MSSDESILCPQKQSRLRHISELTFASKTLFRALEQKMSLISGILYRVLLVPVRFFLSSTANLVIAETKEAGRTVKALEMRISLWAVSI
jgi:hypothetical protein